MEGEFDLRQLIDVLLKHFRLIVLGTVLATLAMLAVNVLWVSPTYEATAGVLIALTRSQITFDPRFQTVETDLTSQSATLNQQAHRGALISLVKNVTIATQVAEQLQEVLSEEEQNPARLLRKVSGELGETAPGSKAGNTDFIAITVKAGDPAKAVQIANAWGKAYEEYVNEVYRDNPESYTSVREQVVEGQSTYEQVEDALTTFIATSRIDELGRLIAEKRHIIDSLQSGRQTAITTMIDVEIRVLSQIIAAHVDAQTQNRLIAFQKEQEGNRALLSSYLDTYNRGQKAVFDTQVEDRLQRLDSHYATKRKMEQLLEDARALYAQVQTGGADGAATNSLAILMLKAEIFSSSTELPGNVQLQLEASGDLNAGAVAQQADVGAMIGVIEDRVAKLEQTIEEESEVLLRSEGYEYLSDSAPLSDTLPAAIQEQYPTLFDFKDLTALAEDIPYDNPLSTAAAEKYEALLQLRELETLPAYIAAAAPLIQAIDELQAELRALQSELAKEEAVHRELTRARDLAWETYSTLQLKADELSIATGMRDVQVRFVSSAAEPVGSTGRGALSDLVLAAALGFLLSAGMVFVIHYINPAYDPWVEIPALLRRSGGE